MDARIFLRSISIREGLEYYAVLANCLGLEIRMNT